MEEIFQSQAGRHRSIIHPVNGVEEEDGVHKPSAELVEDNKFRG